MSETRLAIYPDLAQRAVFISGGATGIGAALVRSFVAQGSQVGFVDIDAAAGQKLAQELTDLGHQVRFVACDITDTTAYQQVIQQLAGELAPFTVLLNNAANDVRHSLESVSPERFDELIAVNLKHQLFAAQVVVPMMRAAGGGSIINFGSISWMMGNGGMPVYTASKAAIHGITRGLARDFGPHGIRVNTLVPGWVMTEKQLRLWVDDKAEKQIAERQCLPNALLPEHIAQMALYLASDAAAMCTSQNFIVDAGWV
ncbi:MAG: SDR family oxidoreductase [Thiolinea sp.]